jgi:hypothetical protein
MIDYLTLTCPRCGNKSSDVNGIYIVESRDAVTLRENPFDEKLNTGVDVRCGVCHAQWNSPEAVVGYRQVFTIKNEYPHFCETVFIIQKLQQIENAVIKVGTPLNTAYPFHRTGGRF